MYKMNFAEPCPLPQFGHVMSHPNFSDLHLQKGGVHSLYGRYFSISVRTPSSDYRKYPKHPGATFGVANARRKFVIAQVIRNFRTHHSGWTSTRDSILKELCEEHLSYTRCASLRNIELASLTRIVILKLVVTICLSLCFGRDTRTFNQ